MEATTLKISNAFNDLTDKYRIGSLLNKNLLIRNLALMRNIGKYSMYSEPMFPEVGMAYNIYERTLNRAEDIGLINGVIGYNNGIDDDTELTGKQSFKEVYYTPPAEETTNRKVKGNSGESAPLDTRTTYKKIVYTTNSNSVLRSGGDIALGEVMKEVNKIFLQDKQYLPENLYSNPGLSVDIPNIFSTPGGISPVTYDTIINESAASATNFIRLYPEGKAYKASNVEKQNVPNDQQLEYDDIEVKPTEGEKLEDIYSPRNNTSGSLFKKTCALFKNNKIASLITRFYAEEGGGKDKTYLSRGRNLLKKGGSYNDETFAGGGYDNPYCRVWTAHNQYSRMTNLIRPRMEDKDFATIARIQGDYSEGYRPANGAKRLSDMSVLKSNGFVNIAPYKDKDGKLNKESIKKCMFSIENLAWRDIAFNNTVGRSSSFTYNDKGERTYENETKAPVLTEEQRGPNGGRIMWFPPYNLSFSEDVTTNWNSNTFIGRGENMYTYVNTERGGSLSFTLLIDHPSVVNRWENRNTYEDEQDILRFFAGCDDLGVATGTTIPADGQDAEKEAEPNRGIITPTPASDVKTIKVFCFYPNNYTGVDDEIVGAYNPYNYKDSFVDYLYGGEGNNPKIAYESYESIGVGTELAEPITSSTTGEVWHYKIDKLLLDEKLVYPSNYRDSNGFALNEFNDNTLIGDVKTKMINAGFITSDDVYGVDYFSFSDLCEALKTYNTDKPTTGETWLWTLLNTDLINNIQEVEVRGYASSHGHEEKNRRLSERRAQTLKALLMEKRPTVNPDKLHVTVEKVIGLDVTNTNVSSLDAKLARCAVMIFRVAQNPRVEQPAPVEQNQGNSNIYARSVLRDADVYDNEYTYFKNIQASESFIKSQIAEKVQYFDPAFHSISPEGFNARLTFLHQCTRQGPTISTSDVNGETESTGVGNLAFGRAPYCILRIGDFYNTKILIESISINYAVSNGGVQWDLNPEGVGVQPMMAEVQMRFKFVGGSDISGPIERLQNAVSFNYYSNASIYDRRADYRTVPRDVRDEKGVDSMNPVYFFDARTQGDNKK